MNIAIICYPTYGGSGIIASELGISLAKKGHKIHFISYAIPERLKIFQRNICFHEVEISNYPLFEFPLYTPALASKITEVINYENVDLVHAHYAIPHAMSSLFAKQVCSDKKISVITTLHGTDITLVGLEPSFLPIMKYIIENSDGVTSVSKFLRDETIKNYNVKKEIEVIPNFVSSKKIKKIFNSDLKNSFAPNGEKIITYISNFRPLKKVEDAILVFKKVKEKIPSKLLLIGDGPTRSNCETLSRKLKIENDIIFLGKQLEINSLLSVSDIFLSTSESESFGLSILEAMSIGLPIVATDVGGVKEVMKNNVNGFLVKFGNLKELSKKIIEVLEDKKLYEKFSFNSLQIAQNNFEEKKIVKLYENFYNKIKQKK